jgi:hypothetical protein
MKSIFNILLFILIQINMCSALTTKTWTGSTNNNFNTGTNWSPSGVPTSSDSCVISVSASTSIILSASISIGALNMVVSGNNNSLILDVVSHLLNIEGNLHMKAISGNTNTFVRLDCGSSSGGVTIGRNAFIDDSGTRNAWVIADVTSPGLLTFKGNVTLGALAQTSPTIEPNITLDGSSVQTVTTNNTSFFLAEDLKIGNTNNPSVILTGATTNGFGCYDGIVSINGTSLLNLGNYTINRVASSGGSFTVEAGATIRIGTNRTFPSNYTTYNLNTSSNTYYDGVNQIVAANVVYGNLFLEGSGTKTLNSSATINGNLIVSEVIFDINASMSIKGNVNLIKSTLLGGTATSHTVEGNWSNNEGVFIPETSTVVFTGTISRTIEKTTTKNLIYSQDFETADNWTIETISGNPWSIVENATYAYTNNNRFLQYNFHSTQIANSWVFSKGIELINGSTYTVQFNQRVRSGSYPEKMKVTVGTFNNSSSQTTTLLTLESLTNTTYTERTTATFVAPSSGTFFFAIQCYSDANMYDLYIDNFRIYEETLTISKPESFYKLSINKTGGATIDLNSIVEISNSLIFTNGIINSTNDYYPEFGVNASVDGTPTASSHVNGPVRKLTNSSTLFTFPVGDGSSYRSIAITPTGTGPTTWMAKYNNSQYNSLDVDSSLDHVSSVEYWDLDRIIGSESGTVTVSWDDNSGDIIDYEKLVVAHFNGINWENIGGNHHTGDETFGTVRSDIEWNNYSPFTIGTTDPGNALPIIMNFFKGECYDNYIDIIWQTLSEMNSSYFEIEKSIDGYEWVILGNIEGNGNSSSVKDYKWVDSDRINDYLTIYYRLNQVDFDGKSEIFGPISIKCDLVDKYINIYPNPVYDELIIYLNIKSESKLYIRITDSRGRLIQEEITKTKDGVNLIYLNTYNLINGIYFISITIDDKLILSEKVVKK